MVDGIQEVAERNRSRLSSYLCVISPPASTTRPSEEGLLELHVRNILDLYAHAIPRFVQLFTGCTPGRLLTTSHPSALYVRIMAMPSLLPFQPLTFNEITCAIRSPSPTVSALKLQRI